MSVPGADRVYGDDDQPVVPRRQKEIVYVPAGIVPASDEDGDQGYWIGGFGVTAFGVYIKDDVTEADWRNFAGSLERIESAGDWMKADLCLYGVEALGLNKMDVGDALNLDEDSVDVYASISRNAQSKLVRAISPSFSHFRLVASKPEEEQLYWLKEAVKGNWSVRELDRQINKLLTGGKRKKKVSAVEARQLLAAYKKEFRSEFDKAKKLPDAERLKMAEYLRELADKLAGQ